jgi:hypothetical protein
VVATVDGHPITQTQVYQALEQSDPGAGQRVLDALVVRQLVREEAEKRGMKVDEKELQSRINSLRDYVLASTGKDFETWLKDTGQTQEDLAGRISIQMLMAKLVLTDQDRKQYFEKNKEQIRKDLPDANDSVIFRQIIVGSKTEAEAIRKELEKPVRGQEGVSGASREFAKLAEERSLDPMTRSRGGMAGWMIKGQSQGPEERDPELEQVLFSLKPGQISEPLQVKVRPSQAAQAREQQLPERWRIVMVEKRFRARPLTLKGNEDVIEELMLKDPKIQLQAQQFFENLRQKAKIGILAPKYKPLAEQYRRAREMRARMQGGAMIPQGAPGMPMPAQPTPGRGAAGGPRGRGGR